MALVKDFFDDGVGTTIPGLGDNPPDPGDGPVFPPDIGVPSTPPPPPDFVATPDPTFGPSPGGAPVLPVPEAPTGSIDPITGQPITPGVAAPVDETLSGVPIGPTGAVTREVQEEELVSSQLEGLLSGDSKFIQNARRRAAELSNRRGQFTSSLFAGAAERAAIEAGLPIAQNDAQAFRDAASQNLVARNQNAIANIQRAASLDASLLSSRTSISLANLDASTRVGIANMTTLANIDMANLDSATRTKVTEMTNATQLLMQGMQSQLQLEMQNRSQSHDKELAVFNQQGRMQLANVDANLRKELQSRGFANDIVLSELSASQQRELQSIMNDYDLNKQATDHAFNTRQSHINMAMQAQVNYINYLSSFAGTEMDAAAASRLQATADAQLVATFQMINGLYPDQSPIDVQFGQPQQGPSLGGLGGFS